MPESKTPITNEQKISTSTKVKLNDVSMTKKIDEYFPPLPIHKYDVTHTPPVTNFKHQPSLCKSSISHQTKTVLNDNTPLFLQDTQSHDNGMQEQGKTCDSTAGLGTGFQNFIYPIIVEETKWKNVHNNCSNDKEYCNIIHNNSLGETLWECEAILRKDIRNVHGVIGNDVAHKREVCQYNRKRFYNKSTSNFWESTIPPPIMPKTLRSSKSLLLVDPVDLGTTNFEVSQNMGKFCQNSKTRKGKQHTLITLVQSYGNLPLEKTDSQIRFIYLNPNGLNGHHFTDVQRLIKYSHKWNIDGVF